MEIETGCLIDGHWGQYGIARVVMIANDLGWSDGVAVELASRHLDSMGPSPWPDLSGDEYEWLINMADRAEEWLNDNIATGDNSFGWHDGEFFYMPSDWWEEV